MPDDLHLNFSKIFKIKFRTTKIHLCWAESRSPWNCFQIRKSFFKNPNWKSSWTERHKTFLPKSWIYGKLNLLVVNSGHFTTKLKTTSNVEEEKEERRRNRNRRQCYNWNFVFKKLNQYLFYFLYIFVI